MKGTWRGINIYQVEAVVKIAASCATQLPDGRYVPARPIGWSSPLFRLKAAWMVFRCKADALVWDGQ